MPLPNTANLNEIVSFLEETVGFNQNAELSSVIGSPTTPNDNIASQILTLQNEKETLATNLTSKGQASVPTEDLLALINKVGQINVGSRVSTGFVNASTNQAGFRLYRNSSSQINLYPVTVTLNFRPRLVVLYTLTNNIGSVTTYFELSLSGTSNFITLQQNTSSNGATYLFSNNVGAAYVNDTGFSLPVYGSGISAYYFAVE